MVKRCWEINKCGRELGGANVAEHRVCPVSYKMQFYSDMKNNPDAVFCWNVVGTLCENQTNGSRLMKLMRCTDCEYFKQLKQGLDID